MSARIRSASKGATGARRRAGRASRGLWVEVEPGFHVGNDRRQFLGSIARTPDGGFSAFGPRTEFIGRYELLDEAKAAIIALTSSAGAAESDAAPSTAPEAPQLTV